MWAIASLRVKKPGWAISLPRRHVQTASPVSVARCTRKNRTASAEIMTSFSSGLHSPILEAPFDTGLLAISFQPHERDDLDTNDIARQ
jgi:hypothetical protein